MKVKCWDKTKSPMRKVWTKLSKKLHLRKNPEHVKLQEDVKSCEYADVHVLWEMLNKHEMDLTQSPNSFKKDTGSFWEILQWPKIQQLN